MGRSSVKFAMGEIKRHYKKKGPSATQKKWTAIEKMFDQANQCVAEYRAEEERKAMEYEMEQIREQDTINLIEWIKSGGEPY